MVDERGLNSWVLGRKHNTIKTNKVIFKEENHLSTVTTITKQSRFTAQFLL